MTDQTRSVAAWLIALANVAPLLLAPWRALVLLYGILALILLATWSADKLFAWSLMRMLRRSIEGRRRV